LQLLSSLQLEKNCLIIALLSREFHWFIFLFIGVIYVNISKSWRPVAPPKAAAAGRSQSARRRRRSQTPGAPPPAK